MTNTPAQNGCTPAAQEPPCIDCGDEPGTSPGGRCRDCDHDHVWDDILCKTCPGLRLSDVGRFWYRPEAWCTCPEYTSKFATCVLCGESVYADPTLWAQPCGSDESDFHRLIPEAA